MKSGSLESGLRPIARSLGDGCVIVACSGGHDSVALLHAAVDMLGCERVVACYVDHGLHNESTAHGIFVQSIAAQLQVRCHILMADSKIIQGGRGIEAGARLARYKALGGLAETLGAAFILTAHTANDQAETLLMRLSQASGLTGLRGILPHRELVIRPWLGVTREEIVEWMKRRELTALDDPTNLDSRFLRNQLRKELTRPLNAVFGEGWTKQFARSAQHLVDATTALKTLMAPLLADAVKARAGCVLLRIEVIKKQPLNFQRLILREALRLMSGQISHGRLERTDLQIERLLQLLAVERQGLMLPLGAGMEAHRDRKSICIRAGASVIASRSFEITGFGRYTFGAWELHLEPWSGATGQDEPAEGVRTPISFPIMVATLRSGARYSQAGGQGSKEVRRLWNEKGIPKRLRAMAPVLYDRDQNVVIAPGLRERRTGTVGQNAIRALVTFRHPEIW